MTAGSLPSDEHSFADQAFAATAQAYATAPDGWDLAVRAAIARLFEFLAERPDETRACITAMSGALSVRDATIDRFAELLRPGFATSPTTPPAVVAEAIGGGIYELVRSHVVERRISELPGAAANATIVALSPFVGADRANSA
jgi:hypothetical protein